MQINQLERTENQGSGRMPKKVKGLRWYRGEGEV